MVEPCLAEFPRFLYIIAKHGVVSSPPFDYRQSIDHRFLVISAESSPPFGLKGRTPDEVIADTDWRDGKYSRLLKLGRFIVGQKRKLDILPLFGDRT